jgi:predicted CoA-binding protein
MLINNTIEPLYMQGPNNSKKIVGCDNNNSIRTKMFDSQIVPKYIIGKDYKIIPVDPATTDVFVNGCTLEARVTSQ